MAKKGYKISEEHKIKIGNANRGKHHTLESKKKLSESHKGRHLSKSTEFKKGIIPWNKNKTNIGDLRKTPIEEISRKISEAKKGHLVSKETRQKIKEARKKLIFPIRDTSIEIKIQNFLTKLDIPFLTHQYLEIEHAYQCDILIPSLNLVIECDGDYWHSNPKFYPNPNEWQIKQIEEDKIRTQELIESGFKVLRLWENEIKGMELNDFKEILGGKE